MRESLFTNEQQEEIKVLMHEALGEFFATKGTMTKNVLVAIATIIGSLVVIGGGIKIVLGFLGFTYLGK